MSTCECTARDYECQEGFVRHYAGEDFFSVSDSNQVSECIPDPLESNVIEEQCGEGDRLTGYRKIPGDLCEGGYSPPTKNLCGTDSWFWWLVFGAFGAVLVIAFYVYGSTAIMFGGVGCWECIKRITGVHSFFHSSLLSAFYSTFFQYSHSNH